LTVDQPTRWAKVERSPQLNKKGKVALVAAFSFVVLSVISISFKILVVPRAKDGGIW